MTNRQLPSERRLTTAADIEAAVSWALTARSSEWTMACARQARAAQEAKDVGLFWSAGFEVLQAYRASRRGQTERLGDDLTRMLARFFENNPMATPGDAYAHALKLAELHIAPFDDLADQGGLVFEPSPGASLENISREALLRRARRVLTKNPQRDAGHERVHVRHVG